MVWETYEISLWTHNDEFISILAQSGKYYLKEGFNPIFKQTTSGEMSLSFTIPIIIFNKDKNEWENNSLWYDNLRKTNQLANEQKVKLIFDKYKKINDKYAHKIFEMVITSITERREGNEVYCDVECTSLAQKWLGKIGYQLTLDSETILLEEEKENTTIEPNINYWLDKVFPKDDNGDWVTDWGYSIQMNYNEVGLNRDSDKIYEDDNVINWQQNEEKLVPQYNIDPIEKKRFANIKESNKYNITQDLAELFKVFVRYDFLYEDTSNPFKITKGIVVYYNEALENTEYAITYKDNETGLSKTSDSNDIVTKLYVQNIESEHSDNGYISISDAPNNITKDNFILNFDYFIQSRQLSSAQETAIYQYQLDIRKINEQIEETIRNRNSIEDKIVDYQIEVDSILSKIQSAQDNINNYTDKLSAIDTELKNNRIREEKVAHIVDERDGILYVSLKRAGVLDSAGIQCNTEEVSVDVLKKDNYGFVKELSVTGNVIKGQIIYLSYTYDVLSYYRNEIQSYTSIRDSLQEKYTEKNEYLGNSETTTSKIDGNLYEQYNYWKNYYESLIEEKNSINISFEKIMGYFLKEGNWNTNDYEAPAESKQISGCTIWYDNNPQDGEQLSYYDSGAQEEIKYYNYIDIEEIKLKIPNIEELVIVDLWNENNIEYSKQYLYNAQYTPQFMKIGEQIHLILLLNSDIDINTDINADHPHKLFYLDNSGQMQNISKYYRSGSKNQNNLVYRRYELQDDNIITSSISISNSGKTLKEYYDYSIVNSNNGKIITFKCNNNVLPNYNNFTINYKCDRTAQQFYYDAQDVSKNSAFPAVSYDVSFIYLQKRLNIEPELYIDSKYQQISKKLNDNIELKLGSIVRINDHQLYFKGIKGIISEISLDLENNQNNSFVVQNYKTKFDDLFGRIVASSEQLKQNEISYNRAATAITPTQEIVGSIIQNTINNNKLIFYSGYTSGVLFDDYGITVENNYPYPNGVTGQLLLRGGNILLSDQIDADGNRIYTTGISPTGINASVITTGRLDTEKINIYSGDQIRFAWSADGLNAYGQYDTGATDYNKFIKFNQDGLFYSQNNFKSVELGWNGLYLGAQDGSIELTANNGLTIYNGSADNANRVALVKLGRFGTDNYEYGLRLYNTNKEETLITSNIGELWLKRTITVGSNTSTVGITGIGERIDENEETGEKYYSPIRIWAGSEDKEAAPFSIREDGTLQATKATITGDSEFYGIIHATDGEFAGQISSSSGLIGGWTISQTGISNSSVQLLSTPADESNLNPVRIVAGEKAEFKVFNDGSIEASKGKIGNLTINDDVNNKLGGVVDSIDYAKISFDKDGIKVQGGGLSIYQENSLKQVFYTDTKGNLTLSGIINSYGGTIGKWNIDSDGITADNNTVGLYASNTKTHNNEPIRFWAGANDSSYNFIVTNQGSLYANNATISGNITASSGHIENTFLVGEKDNGIILYGDKNGSDSYIGSAQYSSGTLGYGWKLSQDGTAEFSNIYARGKIQSSVFEYKKISSVGGSLYVAPTIYFDNESDPIHKKKDYIIDEKERWHALFKISWDLDDNINGRTWRQGDIIKISGTIVNYNKEKKIELDNIDGYISYYAKLGGISNYLSINFEYEEDISNYIFTPGTMIILHGSNNKRYGLYLTAADQYGPYIDVYQDDESNVTKPAVRIGNLQGISDANFPTKTLEGYGLYSSNAYLRGQLMLPGAGITNQTDTIYDKDDDDKSPIRIWAGLNNTSKITESNFIVTEKGYLYAKKGVFEGVVKATNSEFSGTIKAAGIVIDDPDTPNIKEAKQDHFFVAYKEKPTTFNDYVLDIGSHGLSIWEGGLRAYSDYASGIDGSTFFDKIYGYDESHTSPQPYFSLADDGDGETLNARVVAYKGHFLTISKEENKDSYNTNSIIIDNGLWFSKGKYNTLNNIEQTSYYYNNKKVGIAFNNEILNLSSEEGIQLNGKTTYITANNSDIDNTHNESLFVRGQVKVINDIGDNTISLNQCVIQEVKDADKNSIGFNFIVN